MQKAQQACLALMQNHDKTIAAKKCNSQTTRTASGQDDEFEYVFILLLPRIQVIKAGTIKIMVSQRPKRQPC